MRRSLPLRCTSQALRGADPSGETSASAPAKNSSCPEIEGLIEAKGRCNQCQYGWALTDPCIVGRVEDGLDLVIYAYILFHAPQKRLLLYIQQTKDNSSDSYFCYTAGQAPLIALVPLVTSTMADKPDTMSKVPIPDHVEDVDVDVESNHDEIEITKSKLNVSGTVQLTVGKTVYIPTPTSDPQGKRNSSKYIPEETGH